MTREKDFSKTVRPMLHGNVTYDANITSSHTPYTVKCNDWSIKLTTRIFSHRNDEKMRTC